MNQFSQNKKTNGWILCSSKTFPGKFYYFNVLNGEAAWSLDTDGNLKSFNIHKVSDKSHSYPEPTDPPKDEVPNNTSHTVRQIFNKPNTADKTYELGTIRRQVINNTFNNTPTPLFGQPAKFVNELYMPNILWTPIQLPSPMCLNSNRYIHEGNTSLDYGRIVHTCSSYLSRRFTNYNRNIEQKNSDSLQSDMLNTKDSRNGSGMSYNMFSLYNNEKRPTMLVTTKDRDQALFKGNTQTNVDENGYSPLENNEVFNMLHQHYSETFEQEINEAQNLGDDDLRLVLLAKRRKSVDLVEMQNSGGKKIKIFNTDQNNTKSTPKKQVTFNLHDETVLSSSIDDINEENIRASVDNGPTTSYSTLDLRNDLWYVIVDSNTLIDEYQLIEQYVQSDDKFRLLIPRSLQSEVEAMCLGDCLGQQRVISARQTARKLAVPASYIVPLPKIDIGNDSRDISDALKIYSVIQKNKYKVIFITNSTELCKQAESLKMDCLKTDDLKATKKSTPEITFALRKVNTKLNLASEFCSIALRNSNENAVKKNTENVTTSVIKVDANTSPIDNDRLIDITRKRTTDLSIGKTYKQATEEIGVNLKNMKIRSKVEHIKENNFVIKNTKVADIPRCTLSVDTKKVGSDSNIGISKEFCIKSDLMKNNIRDRISEFVCSFTQILEEALTQLMRRHIVITDNIHPPWVLYEVVESVKKMYGSRGKVGTLADKFNKKLLANSSNIGSLNSSMTPVEFMNLFECGSLLIQTLKTELPSYEELEEANNSLNCLLKEMQNPSVDATALSFHTPVVSRTEVVEDTMMRRNFIRSRSDVIQYLKKHFDAWKNYVPEDSQENFDNQVLTEQNTKIVRTLGRNLKLLNIDYNKSLSFDKPTENAEKPSTDDIVPNKKGDGDLNATMQDLNISVNDNISKNVDKLKELTDRFKSDFKDHNISNDKVVYLETVQNGNIIENNEKDNSTNKVVEDKTDVTQIQKLGNTINSDNIKMPTVIRKMNKVQSFEDKLRNSKDIIDLYTPEYSELNDTCSFRTYIASQNNNSNETSYENSASFVYEIKRKSKTKDKVIANNVQTNIVHTTIDYVNDTNTSNIDDDIVDNDALDSICHDSGFLDDSRDVHLFLKMFLSELCQILKSVHDFIVISMREFQNFNKDENWKDNLHAKVDNLHTIISKIKLKLNSIIARESKEFTILKNTLRKAGEEATNDKRMMKYRQVVTKCLEQTLILDNALKLLSSLSDQDCKDSISTFTLDTNIRYFNIYE